MSKIPLGKKENQQLEFKSNRALSNPAIIGREVVAMLNSKKGGVIWVGIGEQDGVAVRVETVESPDDRERDLTNHLIDTLEPAPTQSEIEVDSVEADGGRILRIKVTPKEGRRPYAQIIKTGRIYAVRVADRIRMMSREEIAVEFAKTIEGQETEKARIEIIQNEMTEKRARHRQEYPRRSIWFYIRPTDTLGINFKNKDIGRLLQDPVLSDNRPMGWTFTREHEIPRILMNRVLIGDKGARTEIREDGSILMVDNIERLHWQGADKEIFPWVLLELPTSLVRLASVLYTRWVEEKPDIDILADFALIGIRGWSLRRGSPYSPKYAMRGASTYKEEEDIVLSKPMVFPLKQIVTEPDRCAFRIVSKIYNEFGYREEDMPREYDRKLGKLVMPR